MSKQEEPLFSVVMGVYNVEEYIVPALESVLLQTCGELEVIVVDDGSSDETAARVKVAQDARLCLVCAPHEGSASARNRGIALARGKYVAFLDGDDLWEAAKLARVREFLATRPELDLCYDLVRFIDEKGNDLRFPARVPRTQPSFESLLMQNTIACGSVVVVRREALARAGGFCPDLPAAIDLDLWLRIVLLRPDNVACLPEVLTAYRRREGQITGKWRRMAEGWPKMVRRLEQIAPDRVARVKPKTLVHFNRYLAYLAHEQGDKLPSWQFLFRSVSSGPLEGLSHPDTWRLGRGMIVSLVLPRPVRQFLRHGIACLKSQPAKQNL